MYSPQSTYATSVQTGSPGAGISFFSSLQSGGGYVSARSEHPRATTNGHSSGAGGSAPSQSGSPPHFASETGISAAAAGHTQPSFSGSVASAPFTTLAQSSGGYKKRPSSSRTLKDPKGVWLILYLIM